MIEEESQILIDKYSHYGLDNSATNQYLYWMIFQELKAFNSGEYSLACTAHSQSSSSRTRPEVGPLRVTTGTSSIRSLLK